jgi:hypothetical protein
MKFIGTPGSEDRKKFYAVCGFVIAAGALWYFESGGSTPSTPPPVAPTAPAASVATPMAGVPASNIPGAAKVVAVTAAALDPTLHMDAMLVTESVQYDGTGRNIFSAISAPLPAPIPKAVAPARIQQALTPPPQPPTPLPCPPNCPPIDLKFCGYFLLPTGEKQAIVTHGEDVFLPHAGEIILRRYRVVSISANLLTVEDMTNNFKQSLPLQAN